VDEDSKCTKCEPGGTPYLYDNVCHNECPTGTFEISSGVCDGKKILCSIIIGNG